MVRDRRGRREESLRRRRERLEVVEGRVVRR